MPEVTRLKAADDIAVLGDRAQSLSKLKDHPSWQTLREELTRVREAHLNRVSRRMVSGGISAPPADQREIDYQRGFFAGAEWILRNPETAEAALELALRRRSEDA